jgi:hypothetical protein
MASKKIKKDEYDVRYSSVPSERLVGSSLRGSVTDYKSLLMYLPLVRVFQKLL